MKILRGFEAAIFGLVLLVSSNSSADQSSPSWNGWEFDCDRYEPGGDIADFNEREWRYFKSGRGLNYTKAVARKTFVEDGNEYTVRYTIYANISCARQDYGPCTESDSKRLALPSGHVKSKSSRLKISDLDFLPEQHHRSEIDKGYLFFVNPDDVSLLKSASSRLEYSKGAIYGSGAGGMSDEPWSINMSFCRSYGRCNRELVVEDLKAKKLSALVKLSIDQTTPYMKKGNHPYVELITGVEWVNTKALQGIHAVEKHYREQCDVAFFDL